MKMRSYLKKKEEKKVEVEAIVDAQSDEVISSERGLRVAGRRNLVLGSVVIVFTLIAGIVINSLSNYVDISVSEEDVHISTLPIAAASSGKSTIAIPTGMVKANPFLPYRDIDDTVKTEEVPSANLIEPPEVVQEASDAARLMDTIVSGILFDKHSPSAILNIEGNDYLVKKGDVVNNYKIVSILQDSVTVQLGANTYKAGIGEILTEGSLNHNDVSNLSNKFGGER